MTIGYTKQTEKHDLPDVSSGDTLFRTIRVLTNGEAPDSGGWSVELTVKESFSDTADDLVSDEEPLDLETGEATVGITATETRDIDGGKWYTIKAKDPHGGVQTLVKGRVYFEEEL